MTQRTPIDTLSNHYYWLDDRFHQAFGKEAVRDPYSLPGALMTGLSRVIESRQSRPSKDQNNPLKTMSHTMDAATPGTSRRLTELGRALGISPREANLSVSGLRGMFKDLRGGEAAQPGEPTFMLHTVRYPDDPNFHPHSAALLVAEPTLIQRGRTGVEDLAIPTGREGVALVLGGLGLTHPDQIGSAVNGVRQPVVVSLTLSPELHP